MRIVKIIKDLKLDPKEDYISFIETTSDTESSFMNAAVSDVLLTSPIGDDFADREHSVGYLCYRLAFGSYTRRNGVFASLRKSGPGHIELVIGENKVVHYDAI